MENDKNRSYGQQDRASQDRQSQNMSSREDRDEETRSASGSDNASTQKSPDWGKSSNDSSRESGTNPDRYSTGQRRDQDDLDSNANPTDAEDYTDTDSPRVSHPDE